MHLIKVKHARDKATGQLYGCQLKLSPLFDDNTASAALYIELWHRLRRDNVLSCQVDKSKSVFDASLYFKNLPGSDLSVMDAAVLLNNATGTRNFKLHHADAEATVTEWLQRLDSLLVQLLQHELYAPQLQEFAQHFTTGPKDSANAELKNLLKTYCREQHLFVDDADVRIARAQLKEQRRQAFQNSVQAGQIQPSRSSQSKQHPAAIEDSGVIV